MKLTIVFLAIFAALSAALPTKMIPKQLAGPPAEFSRMTLPTPESAALSGGSAFLWLEFDEARSIEGQRSLKVDLPVDASSTFAFSVFSPFDKEFQLQLVNPNNQPVDLNSFARPSYWPNGDEQIPGTVYVFGKKDTIIGTWVLTISVDEQKVSSMNSNFADGAVVLFNQDNLKIKSHLANYDLQYHSNIGLVTEIHDTAGVRLRSVDGHSIKAKMEMTLPDGTEKVIEMKDDGLNFDGVADDGIWGATLEADEMGIYMAEAVVEGTTTAGVEFIRSTQHMIPVVDREVELSDRARVVVNDKKRLVIEMEVATDFSFIGYDTLFRPYAEVWGTHVETGEAVPICWLSSMQHIVHENDVHYLRLELDPKWVQKAGAKGPFTLKNVFVQESYYYTPLSQKKSINVKMTPEALTLLHTLQPADIEITKEMTQGIKPDFLHNVTAVAGTPTQMLIHGYCAGGNPWKNFKGWSSPAFFDDPTANRLNQDFAELIVQFAESQKMESWSAIGHSQGGVVALYLLNYFFTGMDSASNGKLIQTVGTPWQGCTGAGSAANLVKIFGHGCGSNYDLTTDGGNLFLSGIKPETKEAVSYYTTTYKQGNLLGDYCNLAVNLVLQWPNDGTSELKYSQLEGGNNMGNIEKWCHTTDMSYPAQYTDSARNEEMNKNSAS